MNAHSPRPILRVEGLVKAFGSRRGGRPPRAVDDVSFSVGPGQALGLVGESGSGKTTIARCLFGLEVPDRGVVDLDGTRIVQDRTLLITKQIRRRMQMVFQDPFSSLNPTFTIGATVREGLLTHGLAGSRAEADRRVGELLDAVGLDASHRTRLPRELSGGQCQRAGIARALAVQPDLLVCDEPVSALDVSVRAQIINLFIELKAALGLSLLFIGHDLSIIQRLCEDLVILRNGQVVESGSRANVFANATDAYTRALIAATPVPDPRRERRRRQARRQAEAEVARVGDRL